MGDEAVPWAAELSERLFVTPGRWGWRSVDVVESERHDGLVLSERPEWVEPPRPDTSELRRAVAVAFWALIGQVLAVFGGLVAAAVLLPRVRQWLVEQGFEGDAYQAVRLFAGLGLLVLAFKVLPRMGAYYVALRNQREFEAPFRRARRQERRRYETAAAEWNDAIRRRGERVHARRDGPEWIPVLPEAPPSRPSSRRCPPSAPPTRTPSRRWTTPPTPRPRRTRATSPGISAPTSTTPRATPRAARTWVTSRAASP
ncbi:hypothetical protein AB0J72_12410 [Dactylosporangium sp. NPDC049742]|uniref:hypothetical protein n=1 Tax=Dactylosporangium sp. NPDC049742 TaxID=3154737 RepID=UPI00342765A5